MTLFHSHRDILESDRRNARDSGNDNIEATAFVAGVPPHLPENFVRDLRNTIYSTLENLAILAAFMTALAAAIYIEPPESPACFGDGGIKVIATLEWLAMGCFFLSMLSSTVLVMDVDGVPNELLLCYLQDVHLLYSLPQVSSMVGIVIMATGYAIDLGERNGCPFFIFGIVAAPLFCLASLGLLLCLRRRRARLASSLTDAPGSDFGGVPAPHLKDLHMGCSYFSTWVDRLPSNPRHHDVQGQASNKSVQHYTTDAKL